VKASEHWKECTIKRKGAPPALVIVCVHATSRLALISPGRHGGSAAKCCWRLLLALRMPCQHSHTPHKNTAQKPTQSLKRASIKCRCCDAKSGTRHRSSTVTQCAPHRLVSPLLPDCRPEFVHIQLVSPEEDGLLQGTAAGEDGVSVFEGQGIPHSVRLS
jgi:hypothetical protein